MAWSLDNAFGDVSQAIKAGMFDPQGANYTDFTASTIPLGQAGRNPNDVTVSAERTTERTVGTETTVTTSTTEQTVNTDFISGLVARGVVILLGFIFVAVGLTMFRVPGNIVREIGKEVHKTL